MSPVIHELLQSGVGEEEGGVSFCEIEYDSPDIMNDGLAMTYMISSMPTLLSFDRGEAQVCHIMQALFLHTDSLHALLHIIPNS